MMFGKRFVTHFACAFALLGTACGNPQLDGEIAAKVDQEIESSPVLGGTQIDVATRDGVVTLTGVVASDEQAQSAEKLAWSVEGVDAVESRLKVSLPEGESVTPPVGAAPTPLDGETR
jgi:hyperosmotically inducible protein